MRGRAFFCVPQEISLSLEPANDNTVHTGTVPYLMLYRSMGKLKECTNTGIGIIEPVHAGIQGPSLLGHGMGIVVHAETVFTMERSTCGNEEVRSAGSVDTGTMSTENQVLTTFTTATRFLPFSILARGIPV